MDVMMRTVWTKFRYEGRKTRVRASVSSELALHISAVSINLFARWVFNTPNRRIKDRFPTMEGVEDRCNVRRNRRRTYCGISCKRSHFLFFRGARAGVNDDDGCGGLGSSPAHRSLRATMVFNMYGPCGGSESH